jgi:hypothetical protein
MCSCTNYNIEQYNSCHHGSALADNFVARFKHLLLGFYFIRWRGYIIHYKNIAVNLCNIYHVSYKIINFTYQILLLNIFTIKIIKIEFIKKRSNSNIFLMHNRLKKTFVNFVYLSKSKFKSKEKCHVYTFLLS